MIENAPLLYDYDLNLIGKNSLFFIFDEIEFSSFILNEIKQNNKEVNNEKIKFNKNIKLSGIVSSIIFLGIWIYLILRGFYVFK